MINRRMWVWILIVIFGEGVLWFRAFTQAPKFGNRVDCGLIEHDRIREASGIMASRQNPGVLWTHNDSGGKNRLFALNTKGKPLGVYTIAGVAAHDWEDIAIGPGPVEEQHYLYIGDIGDNGREYEYKYIYRIPEPKVDSSQAPVDTTLFGAERIAVFYPRINYDAEALMVDPLTKDIYILTKGDSSSHVFRAAYPQSLKRGTRLEQVATLPLGWVVGGDISPSGDEILVKTYPAIYYWHRLPEQNLGEAFKKAPAMLPYIWEPQGEAVGWNAVGNGYFTISEKLGGIPAHLYFYPRVSVKATP
ncbi:hypothetical protein L0337_44915 [candidate division KSB1 bacterium]|nr:hypothetical protein [candidate division KSB1 bacterium]